MSRIGQKEIARILGLDQASVSRALSGSPGVSEETRMQVMTLSEKLGYRPNYSARSLLSRKTKVISALKTGTLTDIHALWIDSLQEAVRGYGYKFRLDPIEDCEAIEAEGSADGFVVLGEATHICFEADKWHKRTVFTDCEICDGRLGTIANGNFDGAVTAVSHLRQLGHTCIAFFGYIPPSNICQVRYQGYRAGLEGLTCVDNPKLTIVHDVWPVEAEAALRYGSYLMAAIGSGATAVLASSDAGALGAIKIINGNGLMVPDDISVVGFDDSALMRAWITPITTVKPDISQAAHTAVTMLVDMLSMGAQPKNIVVPASLIMRETTAPPKSSRIY